MECPVLKENRKLRKDNRSLRRTIKGLQKKIRELMRDFGKGKAKDESQ